MTAAPSIPRAVVLLSGGIDSATVLAVAREERRACHALSFEYGQRHRVELGAAGSIAHRLGAVEHRVVVVDLRAIGGSALTDDIDVPEAAEPTERPHVPITYVPARNLIFLSMAAAYAEVIGAADIYIGVNAIDFSGYPDCRPEFLRSFEETARLGTKAGVEGRPPHIHAPLIGLTKAQIITLGSRLGVDFALTTSCYDPSPEGLACGRCDSCAIRRRGFVEAGIPDPTRYASEPSP
jgi:7-cyano-7-deazaguanine synthase